MSDINQKSEKYVVLATKTSPQFAEIFNNICQGKGFKPYQALQMMVDSFVRYTDEQHNLSLELERLMFLFEHMQGWKDALNLADPFTEKDIAEALYILTAPKKTGSRAVFVTRPYMGNWQETTNLQYIVERVIEVLLPERAEQLRKIASDNDCQSLLELLDLLIEEHTREDTLRGLRQEFEDANRSDYGRKPHEGAPYKRKHYKSPDMFNQQDITP